MQELTDPQIVIAIGTLFIALLALIVSVISISNGRLSLEKQQRHNILSVRPLAVFKILDANDKIGILFYNRGTGPLVIKTINMYNENNQQEKNSNGELKKYPINWIEPKYRLNVEHEEYTENTSISNGPDPIKLLYFEFNADDIPQQNQRAKIRATLKNLKIEIIYTDIYGEFNGRSCTTLEYFGRTGSEE